MIKVEEVDGLVSITFSDGDLQYIASPRGVTVYFNEKQADSIAFHLNTILQDRERSRDGKAGL